MGNLCGKSSNSDPFSQPGRTVSSAAPATSAPKTSAVPRRINEPPRTLGGGPGGPSTAPNAGIAPLGGGGGAAEDARRRAAEAAEARANAASKTKGKLGSQLQGQKRQTRTETLDQVSKNELRSREADEAAAARVYN